jgi:hypothetical protein
MRSSSGARRIATMTRGASVENPQRVATRPYEYYGRPTNYRSLLQFYRGVRRVWRKWLNRRTRGKTLTWEKYRNCWIAFRCYFPGSSVLGLVRRVRLEEPTAVILCTVGSVRGRRIFLVTASLLGHAAGNGRYSQSEPTATKRLLYSEEDS